MKTLGRRSCRKHYTSLPVSKYQGNQFIYPEIYKQYVLTLPSKSAKGHAKNIALCLQKIITCMGVEKLIFMGDSAIPWLYRSSEYKPAKEAVEYLVASKLTTTFNGGLIISKEEIYPFFKHLFWLVRTNTVLPYVYGIDEGQNIIVNVCQYGGVHFDTLNKQYDELFQGCYPTSGFQFRQGNTCNAPWSKWSRIPGRELIV